MALTKKEKRKKSRTKMAKKTIKEQQNKGVYRRK
jgi:hypothetical protein